MKKQHISSIHLQVISILSFYLIGLTSCSQKTGKWMGNVISGFSNSCKTFKTQIDESAQHAPPLDLIEESIAVEESLNRGRSSQTAIRQQIGRDNISNEEWEGIDPEERLEIIRAIEESWNPKRSSQTAIRQQIGKDNISNEEWERIDPEERLEIIRAIIASQIDAEQRIEYKAEKHSECAICLGEDLSQLQSLPCGHRFCISCIQKWKTSDPSNVNCNKCPLCRQDIPSDL